MTRPKRQKTTAGQAKSTQQVSDQDKTLASVATINGDDHNGCSDGSPLQMPINYMPKLCLRCHCKQNDPFDNSTPIWCAAFQPVIGSQKSDHLYMASCAANMVCIIDCLRSVQRCDKSVIARYIDSSSDEEFVSLAWSPLESEDDEHIAHSLVLAVGGKNKIVLMSNQEELHCFEKVEAHSDQINALLFAKTDLLFSASYDKCIKLWRICRPNDNKSTELLKIIDTKYHLLSLSYSHKLQTLLASGEKGVFFWFRPLSDSNECSIMKTKFLVDGLKVIGDEQDSAAIRIHLTRHITIIDLKRAVQEASKGEPRTEAKSELKAILLSKVIKAKLESFDSQFPFIYLSAHKGLVVSGGPFGQIWIYDWNRVSQSIPEANSANQIFKVDRILEWPSIENIKKDNQMVIDDKKPVIVNMVAISPDLRFLVACTSINLICIWHNSTSSDS